MISGAGSRQQSLSMIALAVITGVALFWVITLVHGLLVEDYSHVQFPLSTLGMRGAPFAFVSRFAFIVLGLSMLAFGWLIRQPTKQNKIASIVAMGLIVVHGIGRIGEGVFAWNPEVPPNALNNQLHTLFGFPAVIVMLFIPFAVIWAFRRINDWPFQRYTAITAILFIGAFLIGVILSPALGLVVPTGLGQRIGFAIWYIWVLLLAYYFLRHPELATA